MYSNLQEQMTFIFFTFSDFTFSEIMAVQEWGPYYTTAEAVCLTPLVYIVLNVQLRNYLGAMWTIQA